MKFPFLIKYLGSWICLLSFGHASLLEEGTALKKENISLEKSFSERQSIPSARSEEEAWSLMIEKSFSKGWTHSSELPSHPYEIKGAFSGKRMIPKAMAEEIFDHRYYFKPKQNLAGRLSVTYFPSHAPLFYFKKEVEYAGYEYAAADFMRRMGVSPVPYSELFLFYHPQEGYYPVLISQAIKGQPVYKVWEEDQVFSTLDPYYTGLLMLAAMLLNPGDGKEDNFMLSADNSYLIPIDNDHVFLPGVLRQKGSLLSFYRLSETLQIKTLLFCLPHMNQSLDARVVEHFLSLDIDVFLREWMCTLAKVNKHFETLFPLSIRQGAEKRDNVWLPLLFNNRSIDHLYFKFHRMQQILREDKRSLPLELLKDIEPFAGRLYAKGFVPCPLASTLKNRFHRVTDALFLPPLQKMKHSVTSSRTSSVNLQKLLNLLQIKEREFTYASQTTQSPEAILCLLEKLSEQYHQGRNPFEHKGISSDPLICGDLSLEGEEHFLNCILSHPFLQETLAIYQSHALKRPFFEDIRFRDKADRLRKVDIRGTYQGDENMLQAIGSLCPQLNSLNISQWPFLRIIFLQQSDSFFPQLQELVANSCGTLHTIELQGPKLHTIRACNNLALRRVKLSLPSLALLDLTGHERVFNLIFLLKELPEKAICKVFPRRIFERADYYQAFTQYELGMDYYEGRGRVQDYNEARKWFQAAASQGYIEAYYALGEIYYYGEGIACDFEQALGWYQRAAAHQHPDAQNSLGVLYYEKGGEENYAQALKWFQAAAEQNHKAAQNNLGYIFKKEEGSLEDNKQSFEWFKKAAEQGHPDAQTNLGYMYYHGEGVEVDKGQAITWLQKAAAHPYAPAQNYLGLIYAQEELEESRQKEAFALFHQAAEQGNVEASYNLGTLYWEGKGTPRDFAQAFKWYNTAAAQNDAEGEYWVGYMYYEGQGVPRDYPKALEYFERAAQQGHSYAQSTLGYMYYQGLGTEQDYGKALQWLSAAAQQGNTTASYWVKEMELQPSIAEKEKAIEISSKSLENNSYCLFFPFNLSSRLRVTS